jgi:hypothetical protein
LFSACSSTQPARQRQKIDTDIDDVRDRIAIQEKLLYAYAYAWDSGDCASWANLFTSDGVFQTGTLGKFTGRDAIR